LICQTPASSLQHAGSDVSEVVVCPFGSISGSHERELGCEFQWVKNVKIHPKNLDIIRLTMMG